MTRAKMFLSSKIYLAQVCVLTLVFLSLSSFLAGQSLLQNSNWFFGRYADLHFSSGGHFIENNGGLDCYSGSAVISDPGGKLLFYSNGSEVANSDGKVVHTFPFHAVNDIAIVPLNEAYDNFFLLILPRSGIIHSVHVSIQLDSLIFGKAQPLATGFSNKFTVVKHCFKNAWWVVLPKENEQGFTSLLLSENGIEKFVESEVAERIPLSLGDVVSNHKGSEIAVSYYRDLFEVDVFGFDNLCGTLNYKKTLARQSEWEHPLGMDYTADDNYLYVCFSYIESQLVAYNMQADVPPIVIARRNNNFDDVKLAPNGKMYVSCHENNISSPRIDIVHQPDQPKNPVYQANAIRLPLGKNGGFYFPNLINAWNQSCLEEEQDELLLSTEPYCQESRISYHLKSNRKIRLIESYIITPDKDTLNMSTDHRGASFIPTDTGKHTIHYKILYCDKEEILDKEIWVGEECQSHFSFPNAFSPNGDGTNENFGPVSEKVEQYSLQIYNRWGQLLWQSSFSKPWNGRDLGNNEVPQGQYYYLCRMKLIGVDGAQVSTINGSVTLLK